MSAHTVLRNFAFFFGGRAIGDFFSFLLIVVIARFFGPHGTGQYGVAMSIASFLVAFADFGLRPLTIKEVSSGTTDAEFLSRTMSLRIVLTVVAWFLLLLTVEGFGLGAEAEPVVLVIGLQQLIRRLAEGCGAVFLARDEAHVSGVLETVCRTLGAGAAIGVIFAGGELTWALVVLTIIEIFYALISARMVYRRVSRLYLVLRPSELWRTAQQAGHYAISGLLSQFASRTDVLVIGLLLGTAAAGLYAAAYRLIVVVVLGPTFAALSLLPAATRAYQESSHGIRNLYQRVVRGILLLAIPGSVGIMWVAGPVIALLFGPEFEQAAFLLSLLAPLLLLIWLDETLAVFLMASNKVAARARHQWKSAGMNIAGNLILVPLLGAAGAAVATLLSESLLVVLYAMELQPTLGWPPIGSALLIAGLGTAAFSVLFAWLDPLPLAVMIPLAAGVYAGIAFLFPDVRKNEGRLALAFLPGAARRPSSTSE